MGINDLSYNRLQAIKNRGTTYAPFSGSGLPTAVTKKLNTQMTTAKKAQMQVTASKALNSYLSMREMVATEKVMKANNIPIETTRHGKVIPIITTTGKIVAVQGDILSGAVKSTGATTINLADQGAHAAIMDLKVAGLMDEVKELKANPLVIYQAPPESAGFGFKLPDWLKLPDFGGKLAAIGAGVGVGLLVIVGIVAFVFLRKK